jgi:hypothetical protein
MLALASAARAQEQPRVDIGLLLGSTKTTDEGSALQFSKGTTFQATFAWRFWQSDTLRLSLEVPFLASPAFDVETTNRSLPKEYASLYLTGGVRATLMPTAVVSPFVTLTAGYTRYSESKKKIDDSANPSQQDTNTDAVEFGGGVDIRGVRWLGFRAELRDVFTGARNFSIATPHERVHNVVGSAGLVLKF